MANPRQIPKLSLDHYHNPTTKSDFVQSLYSGIKEYGFVTINRHGIPSALIHQAYTLSKQLFSLPAQEKMAYAGTDGQRGYIALGKEVAKGQTQGDLKEYWHIGPQLEPNNFYYEQYPDNVWPQEIPEFKQCFSTLYDSLNTIACTLLSALGEALDLQPGFFEEMIRDGNSVQRLIHYPPLSTLSPNNAVRAAAHVDINLITLLIGATDSGLEILDKDGSWLAVDSHEEEIVVDTGDMMARLTNDILPATMHRVVNPEDGSSDRYSIPFFVHPRNDVLLSSPTQFGSQKHSPISAGDFLHERLRENGFTEAKR